MLWVIPCKFDPDRPVVFDCVAAILEHHPDAEILVVDSDSPDKSYLKKLSADGVLVAPFVNRHYGPGAFRYALEHTDHEFYACIFDSLIVTANLDYLTGFSHMATRHFLVPPNGWGEEHGLDLSIWARAQAAEHMGLDLPAEFVGVMGPMLFAQRQVFDDLLELGFFDILPTSMYEQQACERLLGIALDHLGYDPTRSLQGVMGGFYDQYDESQIRKVNMARP